MCCLTAEMPAAGAWARLEVGAADFSPVSQVGGRDQAMPPRVMPAGSWDWKWSWDLNPVVLLWGKGFPTGIFTSVPNGHLHLPSIEGAAAFEGSGGMVVCFLTLVGW